MYLQTPFFMDENESVYGDMDVPIDSSISKNPTFPKMLYKPDHP